MTKPELLEIMIALTHLYEKFSFTEDTLEQWYPFMKNINPNHVKEKLYLHAQKNKYPPTLSDLLVFPPPRNEFIKKIKKWEEKSHWL